MNCNEIFNIFLFLIVGFILVIGCSKIGLFGGTDYSAFSQLPAWDQNEGSIPNGSFFYVRLARENYEGIDFLQYAMYELKGGPGTDCKIPIDQESSEDIFCQLEKLEGDLWAHHTVIEYNVPAGMCKYIAFDIPWHWNQNAGHGPGIVYKINRDSDDDSDNRNDQDQYCGTCSNGIGDDCKSEVERLCKYDKSYEDHLANCCIGTYKICEDASCCESGKSDESDESWGDDLTNCIGGLGWMNWDVKSDRGIPRHINYQH